MAVRQAYRGDPSLKQYQLTQNFVGGLNTKEADDVVTDIEFRELLNADLGNQGIITNRNGFKDLVVFNQMVSGAVNETGTPIQLPTGTYRLAKVALDEQNIVPLFSQYESLAEFRTAVFSRAYVVVILFLIGSDFFRLKISKGANQSVESVVFQRQLQIGVGGEANVIAGEIQPSDDSNVYFQNGTSQLKLTLPYTNLNPIPEGYELTSVILKTIEYQVLAGDPLVGELKIEFPVQENTNNPDNALIYTNVPLPNTNYAFVPIPGFEEFNLDIKQDFYSFTNPDLYYGDIVTPNRFVNYKNPNDTNNATLVFKFVVEYVFTESLSTLEPADLGEYKSKTSIEDVEYLDDIYFLPGNELFYKYNLIDDRFDLVNPYRATPIEVVTPGLDFGFNVLSANPLTDIDDQGFTPEKQIRGVYITIDNNRPLPQSKDGLSQITGGIFQLNILHTGIDFTIDELGIKFIVNEGLENETEIFPLLLRSQDVGGVFVLEYNSFTLGTSYTDRLLTIKIFEVDKETGSDVTNFDINPGSQQIDVEDASVFIVDNYYRLGKGEVFETVRVTAINTTNNIITLQSGVINSYALSENPRVFSLEEKTEDLEFDPVVQLVRVVNGYEVSPRPVKNIDLAGYKMLIIQSRLVIYKGKEIWFSLPGQFNYIPNLNFVTLPLGTTDEIQRIVFFRGSHIIFTKDEIYRLTGTFGANDFRVEAVNKFIGCIAPKSVRNVNNELIFLSRDGLYKLKSGAFQDNLENVEKIDKAISDSIQISEFVDSLLYDEQYILYYNEGEPYDTLRMYYDINLGRSRSPFVRDIFTVKPELLVRESGQIFALNNGRWFVYGEGYTDFMPSSEEDSSNYTYKCLIETSSLALGFPTHQKKFKNIFIKALHGEKIIPLFITVKVDNYDVLVPSDSFARINDLGEVEYLVSPDPNLTLQSSAFLGEMELGFTPLGEITQQVHKLSFGGKGKNIKVIIEQELDASFGIISMGYLFKLGKVKE